MGKELKYGLKLWSSNIELFDSAKEAHTKGFFDFIELFADTSRSFDRSSLDSLKDIEVTIHAPHSGMFHEFVIGDAEHATWNRTLELAEFFKSDVIVVHPGRDHTFETFSQNLAKIDDPRVYIENMSGLDIESKPMFGQKLEDLERIHRMKPICFDLEKAVKAARYQDRDYKEYISEALQKLSPTYFHISGGDKESAVDEHLDLAEANFDVVWMKKHISAIAGSRLVFETPKTTGLQNDIANTDYFRAL